MAYAHIASTIQGLGRNGGTTTGIDTTGADTLVVTIAYSNPSTPVLSDSKGNSWTALTASTASYSGHVIYYCKNATVGSGHTITISGTDVYVTVGFLSFSGGHLTAPFDQQNGATNSGSASIATGSVTPSENDELIVAACTCVGTSGFSVDSSMTSVGSVAFSGGSYFGSLAAYKIQTTAAAINPTISWSGSGDNAARIATFKIPAAAGTLNKLHGLIGGAGLLRKVA